MDKVYIHNGILPSHKEEGNLVHVVTTWMDLEGTMLSEISQMKKDKCCIISFTWGM